MAGIELSEQARQQVERVGSADVVVGIAGAIAPEEMRARAERIVRELGEGMSALRFVFTWPGSPAEAKAEMEHQRLGLAPFPPPQMTGEFWLGVSAHQRAILAMAESLHARVCIVLGSDLAALQPQVIQLFTYAVLDRQCGLAMPVYPTRKYDALINSSILSPLSRALFGKRIRNPLAFDFAVSGGLCGSLGWIEPVDNHGGTPLLWPVRAAAIQTPPVSIGQVQIDVHHQVATGGLELSAVLGQIAGSLFHEMEQYAAHWQRIRGSQATPLWGNPAPEAPDGQPIDGQPMLDSFLIGSKNLDEVWRLVLPPNTMLELRRLTRLSADAFRMPDELWAGMVYDFALAYRLRTLSRVHLLGALTPLYLGWAASYVREVAPLSRGAAEQRLEQVARAFEEKKPYLLSRWRWPDRFHP